MGAARIVPVQTDFTTAERVRPDRLQAHAVEAAEQCGGTCVPEVSDLQKLGGVLDAWPQDRHLMFCDEAEAGRSTSLAGRAAGVHVHGGGTFVADGPSHLPVLWYFRFLGDDGQTFLPVFTRVTKVAEVATGGAWTDFLGHEANHLRIDRDVDVNHEFKAVARMFLTGQRFSELASEPPAALDNMNIRALLRQRFDAPTLRIVEQVGAEALPDDIARMLGLDIGANGLVLHIQGYGFRDAPLSYQVVYIPPDTRRLELLPQKP